MIHDIFDYLKQKKIYSITLFMSIAYLAFASIASIWSIYIESLIGNDAQVGFIISFFTLVMFFCFIFIVPIIERSDKFKLTLYAYLSIAVIYIAFFFNTSFWIFFVLGIFAMFFTSIRRSSTGILSEKNSKEKNLSKNEGFVFSFLNFSFFLAPIISYFIIFYFNVSYVFLFSGLLLFLASYILYFSKINHGGKKKKIDSDPIKNVVSFFKSKDRMISYILGGSIGFWWSLTYTFMPLYTIKFLPEYWVGIFLALTVVPLFSFEFYFSKLAGKNGYKKYFITGFILAGICAFLSFLVFEVWSVFILLIFASIGLSMLESTTQSYFFDISKNKEDQRYYSIYNTNLPLGAFIGQIGASVILLYLDFRFVFLFFSISMFFIAFLSVFTKNVIESKKSNRMR